MDTENQVGPRMIEWARTNTFVYENILFSIHFPIFSRKWVFFGKFGQNIGILQILGTNWPKISIFEKKSKIQNREQKVKRLVKCSYVLQFLKNNF